MLLNSWFIAAKLLLGVSTNLGKQSPVRIASRTETSPFETDLRHIARDRILDWSDVCQQALDFTRKHILVGNPSAKVLEDHRVGLQWLLRFARVIQATAADRDYPDRWVADELEGRIIQLEHAWRLVHERMPDGEAEQLLKEVFPG
jgi:hypothetical protein